MERLPEQEINKLLFILPLLAKRISNGDRVDTHILEQDLISRGLEKQDWAIREIECWYSILKQINRIPPENDTALILKKLRERGIPEFPAILAVSSARLRPFSVVPQTIDFGCLVPGEEADITLEVTGGSNIKAIVRNRRLELSIDESASRVALIRVHLFGGLSGELLRDRILIRSDKDELGVIVLAKWENPPRLQKCKRCNETSLFWNSIDKKFECLNPKCKAGGPTLRRLLRPNE